MTSGSILLGLALLIWVVMIIARPFLLSKRPLLAATYSTRQQWLARKEQLVEQIRELDFDYQTGKLAESLYTEQRPSLVREAALLLQKLDEAGSAQIEQEIETAVAQLRQANLATNCPHCGQPTDSDDRFCAHCGQKLT